MTNGIDHQTHHTNGVQVECRDPNTGLFVQGVSGNPSGRPKGSRNKLGEQFMADLYDHWQKEGIAVLERAAKEKPADYLKVMASILPKDIKLSLDTMSDGELTHRIDQLTRSLGVKLVPLKN